MERLLGIRLSGPMPLINGVTQHRPLTSTADRRDLMGSSELAQQNPIIPDRGYMLRDGNYAVWFTTPEGSGTGQIRLDDGKISGGDTVISYAGTYENEGERFRAIITTRRHAAGQALLGKDEVVIRFSGRCVGLLAAGSGSIDQLPDVEVGITLMPITLESTPLPVEYTHAAPRPMGPLPPETRSRYRPHRSHSRFRTN